VYLYPHRVRVALALFSLFDHYRLGITGTGTGTGIVRSALSSIPETHARNRVVILLPSILLDLGMKVWVLVEIRMIEKGGERHDNVIAT